MDKKINEIGSEFDFNRDFYTEKSNGRFENGLLTYSGRIAIRAAVSDILEQHSIDRAWLPSYCCDSMVAPFRDLGIKVCFYSVELDPCNGKTVRGEFEASKNDVVLTMGYFGFDDEGNTELVKKCRYNGISVIEDRTHTLFCKDDFIADYRVASLRKWFPIASGGFAEKREASLCRPLDTCNGEIVDLRISAMKEKSAYLAGNTDADAKKVFMDKFKSVNESFSEIRGDVSIDVWSENVLMHTDLDAVSERRRQNARILLDGLVGIEKITPIFQTLEDTCTPLFVPILTDRRAELQKYLAENLVFCPAHWPRHSENANSELYIRELSLVCDQRYGKEEMERIVALIKDFFKEF